jgi:hypothetical protein
LRFHGGDGGRRKRGDEDGDGFQVCGRLGVEFPLYFLKSIDYEIINHRIDYERERVLWG